MKGPDDVAGASVVGADVPRRGTRPLADASPDDQQVLEHDARGVHAREDAFGLSFESDSQIYLAGLPEGLDQASLAGIRCQQERTRSEVDPLVRPVFRHPAHQSAGAAEPARDSLHPRRREPPDLLTRRCVHLEEVDARIRAVECRPDDERIVLDLCRGPLLQSAAGVRPRHLQRVDVRRVDLRERGVVRASGVAQVV